MTFCVGDFAAGFPQGCELRYLLVQDSGQNFHKPVRALFRYARFKALVIAYLERQQNKAPK